MRTAFLQREQSSQQRKGGSRHRTRSATQPNSEARLTSLLPLYLGSQPTIRLSKKSSQQTRNALGVSRPGDVHEREAEHVAERVMLMPEPEGKGGCSCGGQCPECQGAEGNRLSLQSEGTQASDATAGESAPPIVHEVLRSPGQPLEAPARAFMETRFGSDFGDVRVHTDAAASASARSVGALAYTHGNHIVFDEGRYSPGTTGGRKLLAHELSHVLQQGEGASRSIQRQTPEGGGTTAGAGDAQTDQQTQELMDALCVGVTPDSGPTRCEFTSRQRSRVTAIRFHARSVASMALLNLGAHDPHITRIARRAFDVADPDIPSLANTVAQILDKLRSLPVLCGTCADATCNRAAAAYVPDDLGSIVICPFFFTLSPIQQRRTLLHEAGHANGIDDSPDYVHPRNCAETEAVDCVEACAGISDRLRNVDVWARFIECAAFGR